jgi:hypothetical protein
VSHGRKRVKGGSATAPVSPRVLLVRPDPESAEVQALAASCLTAALANKFTVTTFRSGIGRVSGATERERPIQLLKPADAYALYQTLHRSSVLVLAFTALYVRRDPSTTPAARRHLFTLETFVQHKATFGLVRGKPDIGACFARFQQWSGSVSCSGENDPRILPLHSFETDQNWTTLGTTAADKRFSDLYGPSARRTDNSGKEWVRPNSGAYHAPQTQIVAGHRLRKGMHWDVTSGGHENVRLLAPHQVWKLGNGNNDYLNCYPDAYIRVAKSAKGVRLVWPRS